MSKTEKTYDCVESVRKERLRISKETEGMTAAEILAYFKKARAKKSTGSKQSEEQ